MSLSSPKQATEVDQGVGSRIAMLRVANGLSQTALARAVGVSFQQVQKYESGRNRVGAGRLQAIAEHLGVPVSSFFAPDPGKGTDDDTLSLLRVAGALDLVRAYAGLPDDAARRDLLALVRTASRLAQGRLQQSRLEQDHLGPGRGAGSAAEADTEVVARGLERGAADPAHG